MDTAGKTVEAVENAGGLKRLAGAAAVGGGLALTATGSLLVGVVGAGAVAYAATRKDNVGEVSRAAGDAAVATFETVREVDKQHQVSARVVELTKKSARKAKEMDAKFHVMDHTKTVVVSGLGAFTSAVRAIGTPRVEAKADDAPASDEDTRSSVNGTSRSAQPAAPLDGQKALR